MNIKTETLSDNQLNDINGGFAPLLVVAGSAFVSGFGFGVSVGLNKNNRKK